MHREKRQGPRRSERKRCATKKETSEKELVTNNNKREVGRGGLEEK